LIRRDRYLRSFVGQQSVYAKEDNRANDRKGHANKKTAIAKRACLTGYV
jgi:hypothetical protein